MDIDLDQARRRAKELLRAARGGKAQLRDDRARGWQTPSMPSPAHWASRPGRRSSATWRRRAATAASAVCGSCAWRWEAAPTSPSACSRTTLRWPARASTWRSCSATPRRRHGARRRSGADRPRRGRRGEEAALLCLPFGLPAPVVAASARRAADRRAAAGPPGRRQRGAPQRLRRDVGPLRRRRRGPRPRHDAAAARPRGQPRRRRVRLPRRRGPRHGVPGAAARARRDRARHERAR